MEPDSDSNKVTIFSRITRIGVGDVRGQNVQSNHNIANPDKSLSGKSMLNLRNHATEVFSADTIRR